MTIKATVFDIGNVLVGWQPDAVYDRLIGADRRAAFMAAVPIMDMNERVDLGENFHDALSELETLYPDWAHEIGLWRDHWIDMVAPAIDRSVRLLRALRRAGHPVFALSNFGKETFQMAVREYPFLEEFDRHYISGEMGMIKPNPAIYEAVEQDCGIAPGALLFTDDRPENIAAAAEREWRTHLFETPDAWAECLIEHGLLTPETAQ